MTRTVSVAEWLSDMEDDPKRLWECLRQLEEEKKYYRKELTYINTRGIGREYVYVRYLGLN